MGMEGVGQSSKMNNLPCIRIPLARVVVKEGGSKSGSGYLYLGSNCNNE